MINDTRVIFLGLVAMGHALAAAGLSAHGTGTVWNRTPDRAEVHA